MVSPHGAWPHRMAHSRTAWRIAAPHGAWPHRMAHGRTAWRIAAPRMVQACVVAHTYLGIRRLAGAPKPVCWSLFRPEGPAYVQPGVTPRPSGVTPGSRLNAASPVGGAYEEMSRPYRAKHVGGESGSMGGHEACPPLARTYSGPLGQKHGDKHRLLRRCFRLRYVVTSSTV